ncbi:hypothetical protein WR25_08451 [Diploscapter pachys]|uniref:BHLH domain-containing protein n=1 Tax=Diploscapter pachys TaxID=2018661 RepID=A0A2A2LZP8_9BILA|nr:hypothetical protein WR25_08451 [Diploscapter pachys]
MATATTTKLNPVRSKSNQQRRNERERNRVHMVNNGFDQLRKRLGHVNNKKLSKADTLREAIRYIAHLQDQLCIDMKQHLQDNRFHDAYQNCSLPTDMMCHEDMEMMCYQMGFSSQYSSIQSSYSSPSPHSCNGAYNSGMHQN